MSLTACSSLRIWMIAKGLEQILKKHNVKHIVLLANCRNIKTSVSMFSYQNVPTERSLIHSPRHHIWIIFLSFHCKPSYSFHPFSPLKCSIDSSFCWRLGPPGTTFLLSSIQVVNVTHQLFFIITSYLPAAHWWRVLCLQIVFSTDTFCTWHYLPRVIPVLPGWFAQCVSKPN